MHGAGEADGVQDVEGPVSFGLRLAVQWLLPVGHEGGTDAATFVAAARVVPGHVPLVVGRLTAARVRFPLPVVEAAGRHQTHGVGPAPLLVVVVGVRAVEGAHGPRAETVGLVTRAWALAGPPSLEEVEEDLRVVDPLLGSVFRPFIWIRFLIPFFALGWSPRVKKQASIAAAKVLWCRHLEPCTWSSGGAAPLARSKCASRSKRRSSSRSNRSSALKRRTSEH